MTRGVHRVTAKSKAGRQMMSIAKTFDPSTVPAHIRAHNEAVEAKRQEKLARKKARRGEL